jgi:hypothetical protein
VAVVIVIIILMTVTDMDPRNPGMVIVIPIDADVTVGVSIQPPVVVVVSGQMENRDVRVVDLTRGDGSFAEMTRIVRRPKLGIAPGSEQSQDGRQGNRTQSCHKPTPAKTGTTPFLLIKRINGNYVSSTRAPIIMNPTPERAVEDDKTIK